MKKRILTSLFCLSFGLSSCGNTKSDLKPPKESTVEKGNEPKRIAKESEPQKPPESMTADLPYTAVGPVAKFGSNVISAEAFNDEVKKIAPMAPMIPAPRIKLIKTQIIENLVSKAIVEAAVAPTIQDISDAALAKEFKRFTDQIGQNPGGVDAFYKRAGLTEADIKEDMKKGLALKAMLSKDYDIDVSAKEIKEYYATNKAQFDNKPEVKASHILFKAKTDDEASLAAAKKKATKIYKLAKRSGADFAALAKEHSEGPSGPKGGDLGYFTEERMVPPFSKAAFATKIGGITKPVKTGFGYHVIKVFDKKKGGLTPLSEVSETIKQQLEMTKMKDVMAGYLREQKKLQNVEILLDNIVDNPNFKSKIK